jgi:hypothetical protein
MPRKSAEALAAIDVQGKPMRLDPPETLTADERTLFLDIVNSCDPRHFRPADEPLLNRYVESVLLAEQAAYELRLQGAVVGGKVNAWVVVQEKAIRAMVSLAARLRLAPQSRLDSRTAEREKAQYVGPAPWE